MFAFLGWSTLYGRLIIHGLAKNFAQIRIRRFKLPSQLPVQICYSHPVANNYGLQWFFNGYEEAENTTKYGKKMMMIALIVLVLQYLYEYLGYLCTEVAHRRDEI